jgi:hypothetical protein
MERWAANTLRTLGIILTAGTVLLGSAFLLLLAMCAAQGGIGGAKHPEQVVPYIAAAVVVLILGLWFIAWLARGIHRSLSLLQPAQAPDGPATPDSAMPFAAAKLNVPFHLSPNGRRAVYRVVAAITAQILLSAASWMLTQMQIWSRNQPYLSRPGALILIAPYLLYHIPYALLIYSLLRRPDRRAFTYSIAVPAVLILQSLFSRGVLSYMYVHKPLGFVFLFLPWILHIVILVLAYQAIQQVGVHPEPASLVVAAVVTFIYLVCIQAANPMLYRLRF